jgi:hypothetical protein
MPNRGVPPWKWGPRNTFFDNYVKRLVAEEGYGAERHYFGIETQERAEEVRKGMRNAGRHLEISVKAFWYDCKGCDDGGDNCRFHVSFTAYDPEAARQYKANGTSPSR